MSSHSLGYWCSFIIRFIFLYLLVISSNGLSAPHSGGDTRSLSSKRLKSRIPVLRYEDDWVCVSKPAGITLYRGRNTSKREKVVTSLVKRQLSRKVFPVHRLDHRTSGALLLAFKSEMAAKLHAALREGDKEYIALLRGVWRFGDNETIVVDKPLRVDGVLKNATTIFECIGTIEGDGLLNQEIYSGNADEVNTVPACTIVRAKPLTGRNHQIRRHAYNMSMPILGDSEHGDSRANRFWRNKFGLNRLALHCFSLRLDLQANSEVSCGGNDRKIDSREKVDILAPIPEDLEEVFKRKELSTLWMKALQKEPRLAVERYDYRGGTFGRKRSHAD